MSAILSEELRQADAAPDPSETSPEPRKSSARDTHLYALLTLLTVGVWRFSKLGYFTAGDDVGYWLGVAGGVMMLLLFSYPLRKYFRFMHRLGKVKGWFLVHMILGIGGPLLILMHSTFELRSLNATVALLSMLIVALSGIVGRFLYVRVHVGLHGKRTNLNELQTRVGLAEGDMRSRFRFAPKVAERLLQFEARAMKTHPGWSGWVERFVLLPINRKIVYRACVDEVTERLRAIGRERDWTFRQLKARRRHAASLTHRFLGMSVRVAQFTAYERLFSLWHVLHVPFVYILIGSACFHVFAVHAY